jgi:hypothetical protein
MLYSKVSNKLVDLLINFQEFVNSTYVTYVSRTSEARF